MGAKMSHDQLDEARVAYNLQVTGILHPTVFPPSPFNVSAMRKFIDDAGEEDLGKFASMFTNQVAVIRKQRDMCKEFTDATSCTEFIEDRIDAICAIRAALDEKWQPDIPTHIEMIASIYGDHRPTVDQIVAIDALVATMTKAMDMDEQINKFRGENDIDTQKAHYDAYDTHLLLLPRDIRRFIPRVIQFGNRALTVGMSFIRSTPVFHVAEVAIKDNVTGTVICSVDLNVFVNACRQIATRKKESVRFDNQGSDDKHGLCLSKSSDTWTICIHPCDAAGTNEYTSSDMRALTRHFKRQSDQWWNNKYNLEAK